MKIFSLIRALMVAILFPLTVLIMGPITIVLHVIFQNRKLDDAMIMAWGRICCRMSGVRVHVIGLDYIPKQACLFLFNHSSFFDVFALAGYIPGIRFGAKAELFKIPVFGHTMKALGTLPIARANREEVYKIYDEAKSRFVKGEMFALSPEGGRFYGPQLAPFKAGPFVFAMSAQVPIVPVVIVGATDVLPKGQFLFNKDHWSAKIELHILNPIETKNHSSETRSLLQKEVYQKMNNVWVANFSKTN
ncbi:MAG: 1-acyl-sn-glycerol-3-phosphate acyltransferase [Bdellovibrio sp.]|nr:1-acyl-sn-glycerol-3-phosphate acyltransferase [Bdellovibrio sp.]